MASIITATTTSGLTQSADNSGVLQLASGTGNLVTVPSVTGTAMVSGNMPAFSAYNSTSQSVSSDTSAKIVFDSELFDTNSNFASNRFTPTVAGYYQVSCNAYWSNYNGGAFVILTLYKNGSSFKELARLNATSATINGSALVYLNGSTDYIEMYWYSASGTTTLFNNNGQNLNGFSAVLVRGA